MSSETDHPRQRTVAELLAEHGDAGATGRRRRRRAPDELPEDTAPDPGDGSGATAWRPAAAGQDTRFPQQDRGYAAPPEQGGRRRRAVEPEPWDAPRREPSPAGSRSWDAGGPPAADAPPGDLPVRDVPGRGTPLPRRTPGGETPFRAPATGWALPAEPAAPPAPRRPEPPPAGLLPPADRFPLADRPQADRPLADRPQVGRTRTGRPQNGLPQADRDVPTEQMPRFRGVPVLPDTVTGPLEQQPDVASAAPAAPDTDPASADAGPDGDGGPPTMLGAPPAVDAGPPTQAAAFVPDFDDFDDRPAGLGPESDVDRDPDTDDPDAGTQPRTGRRLGRVTESAGQAWAVVLMQWIGGAVGGAVLWVLFRFLWRSLPVVALAAAVLITVGLVVVVRALLRNNDLRTTMFAVLVGLLLTVSPAILVLLGR